MEILDKLVPKVLQDYLVEVVLQDGPDPRVGQALLDLKEERELRAIRVCKVQVVLPEELDGPVLGVLRDKREELDGQVEQHN